MGCPTCHHPDPGPLAILADTATGYAEASKSAATLRGYRSDLRGFTPWCFERGLDALPAAPETVALYRAVVLLTYAAALRRSELVALDVGDVAETDEGLVITLRRSKTDQEGAGATVGVPYGSDPATCPVRALRHHLAVSEITEGPIFRAVRDGGRLSGRAAAARVQRLAGLIGLDVAKIGAHSLRAGLITQAVHAGAHERDVLRHSRHRSVAVFRGYVRNVGLFEANAAAAAGL